MQLAEYQDIGRYLRDSRESLRVSVEEAAHALHIRPKYIRALESGELEDLPGKAYMRGYIRNYAQFLHLNAEEVLNFYAPLLQSKSGEMFRVSEPELRHHLPAAVIIWLSLGGLILLYSIWYFNFHDHTALSRSVAEVPPQLMQLLDKMPPGSMDKGWEDCLQNEGELCFRDLTTQALMPVAVTKALYEIPDESITAAIPQHITFTGEVDKNHPEFTMPLPGGLIFSLSGSNGQWTMLISDTGVGSVQDKMNFIRLETPPLRSSNFPADFIPGAYGERAYDLLGDRDFCFLADVSDYSSAEEVIDLLYWPSHGDEKRALETLAGLKQGSGTLRILAATIGGRDYKEYARRREDMKLPITSIRFKVDLDIPADPIIKKNTCFSGITLHE